MTRREKLIELAERFGLATDKRDHYNNSADEDLAEWLWPDEPREIDRYVAVTQKDDFVYLYPTPTLEGAASHAVENILDSIYAESPVAIYDLDTGRVQYPAHVDVTWTDWEEQRR